MFMKGEDDRQLHWLFEHDVTYGVCDWKRDKNQLGFIAFIPFKNAPEKFNEKFQIKWCMHALTELTELGWNFFLFLLQSSMEGNANTLNFGETKREPLDRNNPIINTRWPHFESVDQAPSRSPIEWDRRKLNFRSVQRTKECFRTTPHKRTISDSGDHLSPVVNNHLSPTA